MITLVQNNLNQIKQLCIKYKVKKIELFGSAASGRFNPESSDIDFLIEFQDIPVLEYADHYFGLKEELEKLLKCPIELVETKTITNPYFLKSIESSRKSLYAF